MSIKTLFGIHGEAPVAPQPLKTPSASSADAEDLAEGAKNSFFVPHKVSIRSFVRSELLIVAWRQFCAQLNNVYFVRSEMLKFEQRLRDDCRARAVDASQSDTLFEPIHEQFAVAQKRLGDVSTAGLEELTSFMGIHLRPLLGCLVGDERAIQTASRPTTEYAATDTQRKVQLDAAAIASLCLRYHLPSSEKVVDSTL